MSYCINPSCPHPKNPNNVQVCQACGGKLRLNGRYQILGTLGKGGFGATFAAADVGLPGTPICVVKQLRPATDDPAVFKMAKQLFEREAQTLGKVGVHPQIPTLLGYFEENQEFYLVQEYVKGNNLHQEVKKNGAFSEEGVKQLLSELLPILTYIHSEKVIHRDIKPANLIRSQTDKRLVLIDFGAVKNDANSVLAASSSPQTALTNFAIGTAVFAPPEQMAMRPVYASDIYALGMTAIYLLTGMSLKDIECNHQTGEIDWQKYVTVSDSFATVLKKMTELAIKYRYKSAAEVLDALNVLPYQEGMMQGMISSGNSSKGSGENTTFRTAGTVGTAGRSSLDTSSTTRIRSNFQGDDQSTSSLTAPQTSLRTRVTPSSDTTLNGSISRVSQSPKQTSTSINRGLVEGGNGGIAYNVSVQPGHGGGRRRSPSDMSAVNKPIQWTTKALLGAYEGGQRDFTDQSFQNLIFGKAFLPAINFYQSNLSYANFQNTDLTRADFGKAILGHTSFKDANLSEAYFGYANLEGADLRGATVAGANFKYANLRGANFCGVDLSTAFVTPDQLATAKTNWRTVMPNGKRGFR
jgi:serine/threonine-protein kinase